MPEIIISSQTNAADVIKALQENDQVLLRAKQYSNCYLIASKTTMLPSAGSVTFSEFKWGRDKALQKFVAKQREGLFDRSWLIRIQGNQASYDWTWAGGETMELQDSGLGGRMVNCYIVGVRKIEGV